MYHFLMPFPSICVLDGNFSFLTLLYRMVDTLSNGVPLCLSSQLLKFTSQNLINTTQGRDSWENFSSIPPWKSNSQRLREVVTLAENLR